MTPAPELRFFNTGEVAIHHAVHEGDSDPTYLFIHGITGRRETWNEVLDPIRGSSRAVAVDLRGHGRSGYTTGSYRIPDYARDMAHLVEEMDVGPVIVVGHSLGGLTAMQLASQRPELVRAIILEDPPVFGRRLMTEVAPERHERFGDNARLASAGLSVEQIANQIREAAPDMPEEEVQKSALALFVTDGDAVMHVYDFRVHPATDIDEAISAVNCPALLMAGEFELGGWMLPEDAQRVNELIGNCQLEVWEDTGHQLHADHPERFISQVTDFVAGLPAAAAR